MHAAGTTITYVNFAWMICEGQKTVLVFGKYEVFKKYQTKRYDLSGHADKELLA